MAWKENYFPQTANYFSSCLFTSDSIRAFITTVGTGNRVYQSADGEKGT